MDAVSIPVKPVFTDIPYVLEFAVQPGTENTFAMSIGNYYYGTGIYDYSTSTKTLTQRSSYSSYNSYSCIRFLDASTLFAAGGSSSLTYYGVNANGFIPIAGTTTSLARFNCFKIAGGKAFASGGGVAAVSSGGGVTQIGSFRLPQQYYYYSTDSPVAAPIPRSVKPSCPQLQRQAPMGTRTDYFPTTTATIFEQVRSR
jgi:hypothetical protein